MSPVVTHFISSYLLLPILTVILAGKLGTGN